MVNGCNTNVFDSSITKITTNIFSDDSGAADAPWGAINATIVFRDKAVVPVAKRVGGRIFYVGADNGATYHFYDAAGNELTTQTKDGLADAVTYTVSGTPTADKFYVYDNTTHSTTDGTTTWSATNGLVSSQYWGYNKTNCGVTDKSIGGGKTNTNTVLTKGVPTDCTPNIWGYVSACRSTSLNDCTDWYIGSTSEMDQLKNSGLQPSWFTSNYIWSSVENTVSPKNSSLGWSNDYGFWNNTFKTASHCCVAIRSF